MNSELIDRWYKLRKTTWDTQAQKNKRPRDVVASPSMWGVVNGFAHDDWMAIAGKHGRRKTRKGIALEYGCGLGRITYHACSVFERVVAIDISKAVVDAAAAALTDQECIDSVALGLIDGSGTIPQDDKTIDHVYSMLCIHHIGCRNVRHQIYGEFARVMKDGASCSLQYILDGEGTRDPMNCFDGDNMSSTYDWTFTDIGELKNEFAGTALKVTGHKIVERPEYNNGKLVVVRLKKRK